MEYEFRLPDVGEGLVEAELMRWLVSVGDTVTVDQAVVEVETAKALVEIPTPVAGTVARLGGDEGQILQVGEVLIALESADDAAMPPTPRLPEPEPIASGGRAEGEASGATKSRAIASPSTRKAARALGVDLATVVGTGPRGRVTRADVEAAATQRTAGTAGVTPTPEPTSTNAGAEAKAKARHVITPRAAGRRASGHEEVPLRGVRRTIAETMSRSWREIPHITEFREIDATRLISARRALAVDYDDPDRGRHLTFLPFMVLACARGLRRHREFNASVDMEREVITYHDSVDIGIATASDEGLLVPVLTGVQNLTPFEVADRVTELVELVRTRRARPEQLMNGTFTITNFGSYGTWLGTPVINPPQSAIAGFGRIHDRPIVSNGEVVVQKTLPIVLAADHRVIDGRAMGAFMNDLERCLADPVLLLGDEG